MNLFRLLTVTMMVFPQLSEESNENYQYRILLLAAKAIQTWQYFSKGEVEKVGSDPKMGEILKKYQDFQQRYVIPYISTS
jgi:hypothetical protein